MQDKRCLASETLADFMEGRLDGQAHSRAEYHLSTCNRCLEALLTTRKVYCQRSSGGWIAVPPEVTQRTLSMLDHLQDGGWWDLLMGRIKALSLEWSRMLHRMGYPMQGALTPVRGKRVTLSEDAVLLSHAFKGLAAEVEIDRIDSQLANIQVSISCSDEEIVPLRVSLVRSEREVASYLIGQSATLFESVPFGRYSLVYTHNGACIGEYDFTIKWADDGDLYA